MMLKLSTHPLVEYFVLPLSDRFTRSEFWKLARQMRRAERLPLNELESLQQARLGRLLEVAQTHTDFWARRLAGIKSWENPIASLMELPPIGKAEIEAAFPDQIVHRTVNQQDLRFAATRGTTQRMVCVHDFSKREAVRAAMVRTLHASGYRLGMPMVEIPPDICDTVCGDLGERNDGVMRHVARMIKHRRLREVTAYRDLRGLIERNWIYRRKIYPPFGPDGSNPPTEQLDYYVDRLSRDRPYVVKGLTTYLYQIAKRILERDDLNIRVPVIKPLGSGAPPAMRETLETAFQGRFSNDYGSAELGPIACDCHVGHGMHVFADLFIVEIVDSSGYPLPPGELGEVVITDLTNQAMPLIRYRVGDLGRMLYEPCECGRTAPRLWIEGRIQDALPGKGVELLTSETIADRFFRESWIDQFQLVQTRNGALELTVVPAAAYEPNEQAARQLLTELFGEDSTIRVRWARTIAAEPGGKFRWVKAQPSSRMQESHVC